MSYFEGEALSSYPIVHDELLSTVSLRYVLQPYHLTGSAGEPFPGGTKIRVSRFVLSGLQASLGNSRLGPSQERFFRCWDDPRSENCPLEVFGGRGQVHTQVVSVAADVYSFIRRPNRVSVALRRYTSAPRSQLQSSIAGRHPGSSSGQKRRRPFASVSGVWRA